MSTRVTGTVTILAVSLTLAGCGGGGFGGPMAIAPERYAPLSAVAETAPIVELPTPVEFAIHDKSSQQSPGPSGTADSSADARPDGTAMCAAAATAGGSASSSFVLGAALENPADTPQSVAVTCDIVYDYQVRTTAASGHKTTGRIDFVMEAREQTTGKLLFRHPLASLSGFEDNLQRSDQQRVQFAAMVSPKARWQILLQAQAQAQASPDGRAEVKLNVTRCRMRVQQQPAPASQPQAAR